MLSDLQRAAGATERLIELLESPSEIVETAHPVTLAGSQIDLQVNDLNFRYPLRPEVPVIADVNFRVNAGEMVAFVGPSGAGKSTMLDLLQRFYDPESGAICLGGHDIRTLSLASLRGAIGFVPQDPVLFSGTLRDNLRYAKPDADDDLIQHALQLAYADEFVQALPDGLDTLVGEDGVGLSGGQRQRLAIARALLTDPAILLLDEATSALDAESEHKIRESIEALKRKMSIIVIAHRLSTVRQADRIVVLQSGAIVAQGAHDELVESSELYARFAKMQFAA